MKKTAIIKKSFNPCFNGYYTSTLILYTKSPYTMLVSILVLMDITLLLYNSSGEFSFRRYVSILVLMDITLLQKTVDNELKT